MIKAWYSPATEDLVEQITKAMEATGAAPEQRPVTLNVIEILKDVLGYDISIEVEVHGDMAKALESLGGDHSDYVTRERPKRAPAEPDDHAACGGGCPTD